MANQLIQIVAFTAVPAGGTASVAHTINSNGVAYIPDEVAPDNGDFTITAVTSTLVTVRNDGITAADCNVLLKLNHSLVRELGSLTTTGNFNGGMTPRPFIYAGGGAGGSAGGGIIYSFLFSSTGTDTGNEFATWSLLVAAVNATPGLKQIFVDGTLPIPTGTWAIPKTKLVGNGVNSDGSLIALALASGAVVSGISEISALRVHHTATTGRIEIASGETFTLNNRATIESDSTTGLVVLLGAATLNVWDGAKVLFINATGRAIDMATFNLTINGGESSDVQKQTIKATGGTISYHYRSPSAVFNSLQIDGAVTAPNVTIDIAARWTPATLEASGAVAYNTITRGNPGVGNFNFTLPTAGPSPTLNNPKGISIIVKNLVAAVGTVTVLPQGGETIDGGANFVVAAGTTAMFIADGVSDWIIVSAA